MHGRNGALGSLFVIVEILRASVPRVPAVHFEGSVAAIALDAGRSVLFSLCPRRGSCR